MADTVHVLSAQRLTPAQLDQLRAVSPRLRIEQRPAFSAAALEAALTPETEILLTGRTDFAPEHAPALRWVQLTNAGVNSAHGSALWNSPIAITNASGIHAGHLAQYTLAVMLSHAHHLPRTQRLQARRQWAGAEKERILTPWELRGRTLGILGYGAIGRELARLARALGMRVLATKRADTSPRFDGWTPDGTGDPDGSIPAQFYSLDELPALLAASDVVVLALPLVDATRHIIGAAALAAMRADALIVNIGRGALIDQGALIAALEAGALGGAALDVTDPEPLPSDSPLWGFENVQITPHIAGMSAHYDALTADLFAENLRRYLAGEPLFNLVDRERGY